MELLFKTTLDLILPLIAVCVLVISKRLRVRIIAAGLLLAMLFTNAYFNHAIRHELDRATRDTIFHLAEYVRVGNTDVVVRTIQKADKILSTNKYSGILFEKSMWMAEYDGRHAMQSNSPYGFPSSVTNR